MGSREQTDERLHQVFGKQKQGRQIGFRKPLWSKPCSPSSLSRELTCPPLCHRRP